MSATTAQIAANMRSIADFLDRLAADVPTPTHVDEGFVSSPVVKWLLFSDDDLAQQKTTAAAVIRSIGGHWDKSPGELFSFVRRLPSGLELKVTVTREAVCERVVTGSREVTKMVPDPAAPMVETTETEETYEWRCEPLLAEDREPETVLV